MVQRALLIALILYLPAGAHSLIRIRSGCDWQKREYYTLDQTTMPVWQNLLTGMSVWRSYAEYWLELEASCGGVYGRLKLPWKEQIAWKTNSGFSTLTLETGFASAPETGFLWKFGLFAHAALTNGGEKYFLGNDIASGQYDWGLCALAGWSEKDWELRWESEITYPGKSAVESGYDPFHDYSMGLVTRSEADCLWRFHTPWARLDTGLFGALVHADPIRYSPDRSFLTNSGWNRLEFGFSLKLLAPLKPLAWIGFTDRVIRYLAPMPEAASDRFTLETGLEF